MNTIDDLAYDFIFEFFGAPRCGSCDWYDAELNYEEYPCSSCLIHNSDESHACPAFADWLDEVIRGEGYEAYIQREKYKRKPKGVEEQRTAQGTTTAPPDRGVS